MNTRQALAALGDTPDAVAAELRRLGVKGRRRDAFGCPIAEYLRMLGLAGMVGTWAVNGESLTAFPAVRDFILAFDRHGQYLELRA